MGTVWQMMNKIKETTGLLCKNWRLVLKEVLVIVLKAFVLYQMVFMLAMVLCKVLQPEQSEYELKPFFRLIGKQLTGYVVRGELISDVCNSTN